MPDRFEALTAPEPAHPSSTDQIAAAITQAIVTHQLAAGTRLAEQKWATQFGVSRTVVRQALFQLSQHRLIELTPARGACVASPSVAEARQVFAVRRMLELEATRAFVRQVTPVQIQALQDHVAAEQASLALTDPAGRSKRTTLLGEFHVRMAELMGNQVLAEMLNALVSRSALITLMYQSQCAAEHSCDEHAAIVDALADQNETLAVDLMATHLAHVEANLDLTPTPLASPLLTTPTPFAQV